jgi:hypothetical protein
MSDRFNGFDRWQFDNRKNRPASAETCIAFEDYRRMGTQHRDDTLKRNIPGFALNDKQLAAVIRERARGFEKSNRKAGIPETIKCEAAIQKAGSYMALVCAIAYRSWRLERDSVTVAYELRVSPGVVRQHLFRMRHVAARLGFDSGLENPPPLRREPFRRSDLGKKRGPNKRTAATL